MSAYQILTVLAAFAFLYSLIASRLERTPVSGPIVYLIAGVVCGPAGLKVVDWHVEMESISWLAELTLAVVLFTDSAKANIPTIRRFESIPARLLLIGLPLVILIGFAVGLLVFPNLGWVQVALLATMVAPTDAALGKAVVSNKAVPGAVRESLNVESGLNDGICVPIILFFLAIIEDGTRGWQSLELAAWLPLQSIGIGAAVGFALGGFGSFAIRVCSSRQWTTGNWVELPVIALSLVCFGAAQWLGGSGFIACFVSGLTFNALTGKHKARLLEGAEGTGNTFALLTWFTFGTLLLQVPFELFDWRVLVYAIASLTVIRMLAVWISTAGRGLRTDTKLFLGWFGPRGLASIVFAMMIPRDELSGGDTLIATTAWTVVASVIAHGLSANPLARRYGNRVGSKEV